MKLPSLIGLLIFISALGFAENTSVHLQTQKTSSNNNQCQIIEGYGRYSYNWDSCLYDVINDNRASSIIELYERTKSFSSLLHLH